MNDAPLRRLAAYGHSYVEGAVASAVCRRFVNIVSSELGCALDNLGVGGSSSADTAWMVTTNPVPPADYYLLMTGLNDARLYGEDVARLSVYAATLAAVFDAFQTANPNSQIIAVEQPHLRDYSRHSPYDRGSDILIDAYNRQLRAVATRYPSVVAVRVRSWNKWTMIAEDTVHPNDIGHRQIARVVYRAAVNRSPV